MLTTSSNVEDRRWPTFRNVDGRQRNAPVSQTHVAPQSEAGMTRSWVALANQMDRPDERDDINAAHLALAR
jgi:hypothetical protein